MSDDYVQHIDNVDDCNDEDFVLNLDDCLVAVDVDVDDYKISDHQKELLLFQMEFNENLDFSYVDDDIVVIRWSRSDHRAEWLLQSINTIDVQVRINKEKSERTLATLWLMTTYGKCVEMYEKTILRLHKRCYEIHQRYKNSTDRRYPDILECNDSDYELAQKLLEEFEDVAVAVYSKLDACVDSVCELIGSDEVQRLKRMHMRKLRRVKDIDYRSLCHLYPSTYLDFEEDIVMTYPLDIDGNAVSLHEGCCLCACKICSQVERVNGRY